MAKAALLLLLERQSLLPPPSGGKLHKKRDFLLNTQGVKGVLSSPSFPFPETYNLVRVMAPSPSLLVAN